MPRKPTSAPIATPADSGGRGEDPAVQKFRDKLGEAHRVTIGKMNDATGRYIHRHSTSPDVIGILEEYLQLHFGAGLYRVQLHDQDGLVIAGRNAIEIGGQPEEERPAGAARPEEPAPQQKAVALGGGFGAMDIIAMLREENNRTHQLMLEMIRSQNSSGGQPVRELVTALAELKRLEPPPAPPPAGTDEIFLKGIEFARKISGTSTSSSDDSTLGFLRDVFELAKPLLVGAKPPAAPGTPLPTPTEPAAAAPIAEPSNEEENMQIDIEPALQYLKVKFRQGLRTDVLAEIIVDQMQGNEDYTQLLLHIVNQPVDTFLALDDEFALEPFKTAAMNLHAELKRRLIPPRAETPAETTK